MANQAGQKPNMMRLIFALLSIGACLTAIVILFSIPVDADAVSDCYFLYSDDIELLAECLDFTVNTSLDQDQEEQNQQEDQNQYDLPTVSGEPTIACDGNVLKVSFEFNQPVSGEFTLYWADSGGDKNQTTTAQNDTAINFSLENATAQDGTYTISAIALANGEGATIYGNIETLEWPSCSPQAEDEYEIPNPDGTPVIYSATCLQGTTLMVVFQFPEPITGQYEAAIDKQVFQYTPVPNYPNRAYFIGPPPEYQGPVSVSLSTMPDGTVVFEQQDYEFPACGVQKEKKDDGGGYVPPSY